MRQLYETTVEASAEYQPALADRQDQASEIDHLRTQLRTEESNRQADNAHFLQQIEQLSDQLRGNTSHDLEELRALHRATKVDELKNQDDQVQTLQATNSSLRDQGSQLRLAMTQLEKERDRAVEDHDSLHARIASTIASPPIIPPATKSDETVSGKIASITRPLKRTRDHPDVRSRGLQRRRTSASPSHHAKEKEVRVLSSSESDKSSTEAQESSSG
ncbi:unnamed protein product [Peronospora destructor]|uniref:Uncharacterized protein n=1 Tax=Peronospora destructor TaxID=86335 RepID=A0AAV0TCK9_9STRA|nr:unnamed protein product [Peronospora destructor]